MGSSPGFGLVSAVLVLMNVAIAISQGRLAPCFKGVELWIVGPEDDVDRCRVVSTEGWAPLAWGRQLMRADVGILICAGIHHFVWGVLRGYGIQVVSNATGDPATVLSEWRLVHSAEASRSMC